MCTVCFPATVRSRTPGSSEELTDDSLNASGGRAARQYITEVVGVALRDQAEHDAKLTSRTADCQKARVSQIRSSWKPIRGLFNHCQSCLFSSYWNLTRSYCSFLHVRCFAKVFTRLFNFFWHFFTSQPHICVLLAFYAMNQQKQGMVLKLE